MPGSDKFRAALLAVLPLVQQAVNVMPAGIVIAKRFRNQFS